MAKYVYEDIERLPLTDELFRSFAYECDRIFQLPTSVIFDKGPQRYAVSRMLYAIVHVSLKNTLVYTVAATAKERAMAAFEYTGDNKRKQEVLDIWLKYADKLTGLEKAMLGWDKI